MKKFFGTLLILSVLITSSCNKSSSLDIPAPGQPQEENVPVPIAKFTISNVVDQVLELVPLNIENQSQNGETYFWDFGDGTTSTDRTPSFSFNMHGAFTIKLTVKNKKGVSSEFSYNRIGVICRGRAAGH